MENSEPEVVVVDNHDQTHEENRRKKTSKVVVGTCTSHKKKKKKKRHLNPCNNKKNQLLVPATNWLELPRDMMVLIFQKLGIAHMVTAAQPVCTLWRDIAEDPIYFRFIRLDARIGLRVPRLSSLKAALSSVARSCGHLVGFSCDFMFPFRTEHLHQIADLSTSSMKSLRLGYCHYVDPLDIAQVVKKIPSLEELYMADLAFPKGTIDEIGRSCLNLKHLRLVFCSLLPPSDEEAFSIAENLPNLCRLRLDRNILTNVGLQAIIDRCRHLEYFFLSRCPNIDVEGDLLKKQFPRIQNIRTLSKDPDMIEYEVRLQVAHDVRSQLRDYDLDFSNSHILPISFDPSGSSALTLW